LHIEPGGPSTVVASGGRNRPWTGVTFHPGNSYVTEGGDLEGGRIFRITPDGRSRPVGASMPLMAGVVAVGFVIATSQARLLMHRSRLGQIIIDCSRTPPDRAADFWSAALGRPARSLESPEDAAYRLLDGPAGEPRVMVQQVEHASRVHLDIETDDVEAEVCRLEALGARRIAFVRHWWVLEAPTGQRFCVLPPQRPDFPDGATAWP